MESRPAEPVAVSLYDLQKGIKTQTAIRSDIHSLTGTVPLSTLEKAFGPTSLGILVVKDLEPKFLTLRHKLLSYASYLANLPPDDLGTYQQCPAKRG